jgi:hypothetical protein
MPDGSLAAQLGRQPRLDGDAARLLTQRAALALLERSLPDLAPEHRTRARALWQQPPPPPPPRDGAAAPAGAAGAREQRSGDASAAEAVLAAPALPVVQGLADRTLADALAQPAAGPAAAGAPHHVGAEADGRPEAAGAKVGALPEASARANGTADSRPANGLLNGGAAGGDAAAVVREGDGAVYAELARGYVWKLDVHACAAA